MEKNPGAKTAKEQLNQFDFDPTSRLRAQETAGNQVGDNHYDDTEAARHSETAPDDFSNQQSDGFRFNNTKAAAGGTNSKASGGIRLTRKLAKGGPVASIAFALIAAMLGVMSIQMPSAVVNHFAETVTERFNTQSMTAEHRVSQLNDMKTTRPRLSRKFVPTKYTGGLTQSKQGFFRKKVRFSTVSQKQIDRFKNIDGLNVKYEDSGIFGKRKRLTEIEYTNGAGEKQTFTNARDLEAAAEADPTLAGKLQEANRGKLGMMFDKAAKTVRRKLGILFTRLKNKIKGNDKAKNGKGADAETDTSTDVDADAEAETNTRQSTKELDSELETRTKDGMSSGDDIINNAKQNADPNLTSTVDDLADDIKTVDGARNSGKPVSGATMSKIGSKVLGAIDKISQVCSIYNMINRVVYTAKVFKAFQLARYASMFLTMSSSLKAGDATEEEVSYFANKLMATNPIMSGGKVTGYEPTALDSKGFMYALNGFMSPVNYDQDGISSGKEDSALKYQLGFNNPKAMQTFFNMKSFIKNQVPAGQNIDQFCGAADSKIVNFGMTAISILAGLASCLAGCGLLVHQFVQGAGIAATFIITKMWLAQTIEKVLGGTFVTRRTQGEDAGNAIVAGSGYMLGNTARSGGNMLMNKEDALSYLEKYDKYLEKQAEIVRATRSPFDISTKHTMMGKIVSGALPYMARMYSAVGRISSVLSYAGKSLKQLLPRVSALDKQAARKASLNYCVDSEYTEFAKKHNLAMDPFCNWIYGLPTKQLRTANYSPDAVLEYLAPGTFEKNPDGSLGELADYTTPLDEKGNPKDWNHARAQAKKILNYARQVISKGYLKPVNKDGKECSFRWISKDGRLESVDRAQKDGLSGLDGAYSVDQRVTSCANANNTFYEFEWKINDRKSADMHYYGLTYDNLGKAVGENWVPTPSSKHPTATTKKDNKLFLMKENCIDRGDIPFGMEQLIEKDVANKIFEGRNINQGESCTVNSDLSKAENKEKMMMALYFMDERLQCMLDEGEDCDDDAMVTGSKDVVDSNSDNDTASSTDNNNNLANGGTAGGCGSTAFKGKKYNLDDDKLRRIAAALTHEQGSDLGAMRVEASLLANLSDQRNTTPDEYIQREPKKGGFFAGVTRRAYASGKGNGPVTQEMIEVVRDVLVNGNRLTTSDEHDSFKDIVKLQNGSQLITDAAGIRNRSNYISGQTIVYNRYGSKYRFECFPSARSDPFGKRL